MFLSGQVMREREGEVGAREENSRCRVERCVCT
jgi:hypothetical protein